MAIKVEIVRKAVVKPSCPTPDHLKTVDLSAIDILAPPSYVEVILFYGSSATGEEREISDKLKKSLSEALTEIYTLAGTMKRTYVDCNDEGAVYQEARVSGSLPDFLRSPDLEAMNGFVPANGECSEAATWPLLLVQANFFVSGGLAIGISFSHKIGDAESLAMFVQCWAAAATPGTYNCTVPEFTVSKVFPPSAELSSALLHTTAESREQTCVTKRFVFSASNVAKLKKKASNVSGVKDPTRVEVVTSLIWKCFTKASRSNSGKAKQSVLQQAASLRRRKGQSLSGNCFGNLLYVLRFKAGENELALDELIKKIRQEKENFNVTSREELDGDGATFFLLDLLNDLRALHSQRNSIDLYGCTSWCKMPFYDADFGWGKPTWVMCPARSTHENLMLLIDSKDGEGIEARVTLMEEEMAVFELDPELLNYASLNPGIPI